MCNHGGDEMGMCWDGVANYTMRNDTLMKVNEMVHEFHEMVREASGDHFIPNRGWTISKVIEKGV